MEEISEKELSIRRMGLSPWQDGVTKLAVSNKEKRKQLWEIWRTNNPESKKTWRTDRKQGPNTLRCQAPVVIKKISTNITEQENSEENEPEEPATLERSNSIRSEISDIDVQIPTADARKIQEEVQEMRDKNDGEFILNPTFNNPAEAPRETIISEIFIDEENQTKWSRKHLTAHDFKIEPFPTRALSETNRYDLRRFYEYIPEEVYEFHFPLW